MDSNYFIFLSLIKADAFTFDQASPIRQGVHVEWYRTVAPSLDGSAIFVWSDTRYGVRMFLLIRLIKMEILLGETMGL